MGHADFMQLGCYGLLPCHPYCFWLNGCFSCITPQARHQLEAVRRVEVLADVSRAIASGDLDRLVAAIQEADRAHVDGPQVGTI
jgi:hypothetical protein